MLPLYPGEVQYLAGLLADDEVHQHLKQKLRYLALLTFDGSQVERAARASMAQLHTELAEKARQR